MHSIPRTLLATALVVLPTFTAPAQAQAVDLHTWTAASYPSVSGFPAGVWNVASTGASVTQTQNGQPTMFYSDFTAMGTEVRGRLRSGGGDDDYIGFALGFEPNDTTNPAADYLLVDWKQGNQFFDFGPPSTTPGSTAHSGLAVSRVTGIPTADEFWGHVDFATDTAGAVQELQRAATLGATGWAANVEYEFRFVFTTDRLQVFVGNVPQLDVSGSFADGRLAFYNFSQGGVTYSAFEVQTVITSFCQGDGVAPHTACPCGNNSPTAANAGCLNSFGNGGTLRANGSPSLAADTVVLVAGSLPAASTLFFQGTAQVSTGNGAVFGDGLRCAGGTIVRLRTKPAVGTPGSATASYPAAGDASVSVRGLVAAPGTRTYQVWYRNAAQFCTASTFNLTNGIQIQWGT